MDVASPEPARLEAPAIDRMRIAYMAVSMRDPNPVHVEEAVAVRAGMPTVIAHGTFVLGYAGVALTRAYGFAAVRRLHVDVTAPVFPGDVLTTELEVVDERTERAQRVLLLQVRVLKPDGTVAGRGTAEVAA